METTATFPHSTYQPASLEKRFLAFVIDTLVLGATLIPSWLIELSSVHSYLNGGYADGLANQALGMPTEMNQPSALMNIIYLTLSWTTMFIPTIYYLLQDGLWQGRTPGRRILGLTVVHLPSGNPCTRIQSAVRRGASLAFLAIPLGVIADSILMLIDPAKRRPGDYYANTMVVSLAEYEQVQSISREAEKAIEEEEPSPALTPQLSPSYLSAAIHPAVLCLVGLIAALISQEISTHYYFCVRLGVIEGSTLVDLLLSPLTIAGACYSFVVFALLPLIPKGKPRKWACIFTLLTASAGSLIESLIKFL